MAVITAYNAAYREIGELCASTLRQYANIHGYETRVYGENLAESDLRVFKLDIIERCFAEGFEWVFWLDSDTLICDLSADIGAEIQPNKLLYLAWQTVVYMPMYGVREKVDVPNTGVMLLHNSPFIHELLSAVRLESSYRDGRANDNTPLNRLIGYSAKLPPASQPNRVHSNIRRHVKFLNPRWNVIKGLPLLEAVDNPIILHYQAQPYEQRLFAMHADYRRYHSRTTPPRVTHVQYNFAQPYDGDGWYPAECTDDGMPFRWMGRHQCTLHFPLSLETDYTIHFRVINAITQSTLDSLSLWANDVLIVLEREREGSIWHYSGILPRHAISRRADSELALAFTVDELHSPSEFDPEADKRHLGAAIADLRITPTQVMVNFEDEGDEAGA